MNSECSTVEPSLAQYIAELEASSGLVKVGSRCWTAVGYGGNINFIEGDDGVIVFNTGTTIGRTQDAIKEFRKFSSKPVLALVYSHGYLDHTGGSPAFIREAKGKLAIYASSAWEGYVTQAGSPAQPEVLMRIAGQLGWLLPIGPEGTVGNALHRALPGHGGSGYLKPTHSVADRLKIRLAGIDLELIPAPHDLDDGMMMWLPDERILFAGDVLLPGMVFPPLATPRFEARRDPQKWIAAMALADSFAAEILVPAWGPPFIGREEVHERLSGQRRVSQFMVDDVYRRILAGELADDIASDFTLPPSVTGDRIYGEQYHRLSWIIRSLISREFGHLSGDVLELVQLPPKERAVAIAEEFGGISEMVSRARRAFDDKKYQWSLELATIALRLDPANADAGELRQSNLRSLAYTSPSANERNYLLFAAMLEAGNLDRQKLRRQLTGVAPTDVAFHKPPEAMLDVLGPKLKLIRENREKKLKVRFEIKDIGVKIDILITEDVMLREIYENVECDLSFSLSYENFIKLIQGMDDLFVMISNGSIDFNGDKLSLNIFYNSFDWRS